MHIDRKLIVPLTCLASCLQCTDGDVCFPLRCLDFKFSKNFKLVLVLNSGAFSMDLGYYLCYVVMIIFCGL